MVKLNFLRYFLLLPALIFAQDKVDLRISVKAELPEDSSIVYISGNLSEFGNWSPGKIPLENKDGLWSKVFRLERGTSAEFKFTLGSWTREAVGENGDIPPNYSILLNSDTTMLFHIGHWKDEFRVDDSFKGQVTGTVKYHKVLGYRGLEERELIVWLPPGYYRQDTLRYPVLYMHDGQNIIDPSTSLFGIDWQIDEAADSLIKKGEIPPIIIVGIYNSRMRSKEYLPNDTAGIYMEYLIKRIKFMIDNLYRTLPGREFTSTGGSSAGGTISFMLLWEHPEVFSKALCFSPAFKFRKIDFVTNVADYTGDKKDIKIYIDNGGLGTDTLLQSGIVEMISELKKKGFKEGEDFVFELFDDHHHSERYWARRIPNALLFLFGVTK